MAIAIQSRKRGRAAASISMAPMIDMVFLLLVFFMTASAMSQAGTKLELALPDSSEAEVARDFSGRLILSVDVEGNVYRGSQRLDGAALAETLRRFREAQPEAKLSLRADRNTPYKAIRAVMREAAAAGIDRYLYASYQTGGEQ